MHSKLFQIKCFNAFALVTINHSSPPPMMLLTDLLALSPHLITYITPNYSEALTNYANNCNH